MGSGDYMSLSEKMINLMDASRTRLGSTSKLGLDDLTQLLLNNPTDVRTLPWSEFHGNHDTALSVKDDVIRVEATAPDTKADEVDGIGLYAYPGGTVGDSWGTRSTVHVRALIRGNMRIVGFARQPINIQLQEDKWTEMNANYHLDVATFYGAPTKSGEWFEIKNIEFTILGGVIKRFLYSLVPHKSGGACYAA